MSFLSISLYLNKSSSRECAEAGRVAGVAGAAVGAAGAGEVGTAATGVGVAARATTGATGAGATRAGAVSAGPARAGGVGGRALRARLRGLASIHSSSSSWREGPRRRGGGGEGERTGSTRTSRSTGASGFICFSWYRCSCSNFSSISGLRFSCFKALLIAEILYIS